MRRHLVLALWLLLPMAWVGHAQELTAPTALLSQVQAQLQQAPVLRGEFTQEKTLKGFKQPLLSSGRFVVAQGKGMVWLVQQPFASTLRLSPQALQSLQADGSLAFEMQASQEPVVRTINSMLLAVMSADVALLHQHFHVTGSVQGSKGWQLTLTPRDKMLAQWIQKIEVHGQQFVQQVKLLEGQGEVSLISIRNMALAQSLQGLDAQLFD